MATTTLASLAQHLESQGLKSKIVGDGQTVVHAVNTLEDAGEGEISFLTNPKYRQAAQRSKASAIIVAHNENLTFDVPVLRCDDPYAALTIATVHIHGYRRHPQWGISERATIAEDANIGPGASIAAGATIEEGVTIGKNSVIYPGTYIARNVAIGDDVVLYPGVTIYEQCRLGDRVTIHAGTVIGEDGLGYAPVEGKWIKIPQVGWVVIEDDVEIGSNCTIDRATMGMTRIGSGTKFSNLVAIGHGAKVGEDCMFVALVGVAGSAVIGKCVTIAGQAGIVGHITVGDKVQIGAQAGVAYSLEAGAKVLGSPAVPITDAKRQFVHIKRLPEMKERIKALEQEVQALRRLIQENGKTSEGTDGG
ncbi:MAG: UDP-3-O-(3-hydroxymyristoyl)glucosamine N-acyltransferase [Phycisphaerae bacterium]|nr:UDP-3-O-(3-hydroxymyristoyl)glucosamine N-acyltransferase [Phycisphaerae bacterium]